MVLLKRSGEKIDIELEDNILSSSSKIGQRDSLLFTCNKCGKKASRRISLFNDINNINDRDLYCQQCNMKHNNLKKYGVDNTAKLPSVKEKMKQTNLKKYGGVAPASSKEIRYKIQQTNTKRYGGLAPACSSAIQDKIKETNLKKYGTEYGLQNEEIKEKIKQTNLKKYGCENVSQNKEIKEKAQNTNLKIYGFKSALQNEEVKEKIKKTNLERYGVEYVFQNEEVKEKIKKTNLERYDVEFFKQYSCLKLKDLIEKLREKNITVLNELNEDDFSKTFNEWINKNTIILKSQKNKKYKITTYTGALNTNGGASNISNAELEIYDFLKSIISTTIISNSRNIISPYELDIYLPDYNLGIEYNGLYWHSKYGNKYHINKTNLANNKGIRLIQIFEDEWLYKRNIVKERLRNALNLNENIIHAKKCIIKEVGSKEKNVFLEKYHIQGKDNVIIKLGAYFEDSLVGVMTFSNYRKAINNEYELSRFAIIHNTKITGLASKLYKYFIKMYSPNKIISYSDIRWNTENVYNILGMKYVKTTTPNYWWCKNHKRYNRFKSTSMKHYKKNRTEREIMLLEGFTQIYDCGNLLFEHTIEQ